MSRRIFIKMEASLYPGQVKMRILAWKDGNFVFEKENIESIMRKVARWYNVEIVYKGERPKELYSGITKRSGNVSQILSILEETGTESLK